jgi:hypothetical protein
MIDPSTINDLNDFDRGELDCLYGYSSLQDQSQSYYDGYGKQYAIEQTVGGQTNEPE